LIDVDYDRREDFPQSFMQVVAAEALNPAIPAVMLGVPVLASVPQGPMDPSWVVLSPQTSSIDAKTKRDHGSSSHSSHTHVDIGDTPHEGNATIPLQPGKHPGKVANPRVRD
jgi:hypothetical protein